MSIPKSSFIQMLKDRKVNCRNIGKKNIKIKETNISPSRVSGKRGVGFDGGEHARGNSIVRTGDNVDRATIIFFGDVKPHIHRFTLFKSKASARNG